MAKPMSGQPGCSYRVPPRSLQHRPSSRRRNQHPATHPSPHFAAPSSGLLSLLATIAASSATADGSPIPPSFLCPSVDYETSTITSNSPQDNLPPDAIQLPPTSTNRRRNIPDQYQPGPDGRWRRVETYTLYGSTVCAVRKNKNVILHAMSYRVNHRVAMKLELSLRSTINPNLPPPIPWTHPFHLLQQLTYSTPYQRVGNHLRELQIVLRLL
jgi:hypothetical protein